MPSSDLLPCPPPPFLPCPPLTSSRRLFGAPQTIIGAKDVEGASPLHHACRRHHNEIVAMLIDAGALVNDKNDDLSTALHWAARKVRALQGLLMTS